MHTVDVKSSAKLAESNQTASSSRPTVMIEWIPILILSSVAGRPFNVKPKQKGRKIILEFHCVSFQEIAALLISFDKHSEWQSKEVRTRWVTQFLRFIFLLFFIDESHVVHNRTGFINLIDLIQSFLMFSLFDQSQWNGWLVMPSIRIMFLHKFFVPSEFPKTTWIVYTTSHSKIRY